MPTPFSATKGSGKYVNIFSSSFSAEKLKPALGAFANLIDKYYFPADTENAQNSLWGPIHDELTLLVNMPIYGTISPGHAIHDKVADIVKATYYMWKDSDIALIQSMVNQAIVNPAQQGGYQQDGYQQGGYQQGGYQQGPVLQSEGLPKWVLPVAAIGAAYLIFFKKKVA